MKGAKDSKDGGYLESYVSANSMLTSFLYHLVRHLSLTLSIPSLFDQVDGNVANKETEVKSLGVKGVKDSNDGGVKDSYVSANSMLTSFLYHLIRHLSLTYFINSFSLLSGQRKRREGNRGQVPWCEGETFQGRWRQGQLRECQQVC